MIRGLIVTTLLLTLLIGGLSAVGDVYVMARGFTPGAVRYNGYSMYNNSEYRVNPDSSVTFRNEWTDTWITLPITSVQMMPRATWWWQRMTPPKVGGK